MAKVASSMSDESANKLKSDVRALQDKMMFLSDEFNKMQEALANSGVLGGSPSHSQDEGEEE